MNDYVCFIMARRFGRFTKHETIELTRVYRANVIKGQVSAIEHRKIAQWMKQKLT